MSSLPPTQETDLARELRELGEQIKRAFQVAREHPRTKEFESQVTKAINDLEVEIQRAADILAWFDCRGSACQPFEHCYSWVAHERIESNQNQSFFGVANCLRCAFHHRRDDCGARYEFKCARFQNRAGIVRNFNCSNFDFVCGDDWC